MVGIKKDNLVNLSGKCIVITGASRGIGKAIALTLAKHKANLVILAKTDSKQSPLDGSIHQTADEVRALGGQALAVKVDIRSVEEIKKAIDQAVQHFGQIDIVVNNASAISLTSTLETDPKRFDLLHQVNVRGTFLVTKYCLPYLLESANPHIVTIAPPLTLDMKWWHPHFAYTYSKIGMSLFTVSVAAEYAKAKLSANCLWPATLIDTAALNLIPTIDRKNCRTPQVVADALYHLISQPAGVVTGQCLIDEEILIAVGESNFTKYAVSPGEELAPDYFL